MAGEFSRQPSPQVRQRSFPVGPCCPREGNQANLINWPAGALRGDASRGAFRDGVVDDVSKRAAWMDSSSYPASAPAALRTPPPGTMQLPAWQWTSSLESPRIPPCDRFKHTAMLLSGERKMKRSF